MGIVANIILFAAIAFVIISIGVIRAKISDEEFILPPILMSVVFFGIFTSIVAATAISPFHLLWLFPTSFAMGFAMLAFPATADFIELLVVLLSKTKRNKS